MTLPAQSLWLLTGMLLLLGGCRGDNDHEAQYPRRPIKLVVPFAAGGGSDVFGRMIQDAITTHELLPEPVVIINVPGAGGTVGSRRVKNARPDGYTLLLLHEGMFTARHSGQAAYGHEAFEAIAGTTNATQVIAVNGDSPFADLSSLMGRVRERPDSVVFSANLGAPSHFAGLMLESESPGAAFRYTQTGGGAKRFAALQGGHVDVSAFSIAEYLQFRQSGLKALALLGPRRDPELPDLPTAAEQGYDVISQNMQFWWAPKGTPEDRIERIAAAVEAAMDTPEIRRKLDVMHVAGDVLTGESLERELRTRNRRIASVAPGDSLHLPDFAKWSLWAVIATGSLASLQAWRRHRSDPRNRSGIASSVDEANRAGHGRVVAVVAATLLYLFGLQWDWYGFRLGTTVYVIVTASILGQQAATGSTSGRIRILAASIAAGCFAGLALYHLFTDVLVVDLP